MVSCLPQILKGTKCQCFLKIALDSSTKELWILEFLEYLELLMIRNHKAKQW